jgi:hypothetical protein
MDLGVACDNGQGTGNERGVLTNDMQVVDRGRQHGFDLARCSGAVVLGYRREGKGGASSAVSQQQHWAALMR